MGGMIRTGTYSQQVPRRASLHGPGGRRYHRLAAALGTSRDPRSRPMKPAWICGLLALSLVLIAAAPARADGEDDRLVALFKGYLDELFRTEPLSATQLGEHK